MSEVEVSSVDAKVTVVNGIPVFELDNVFNEEQVERVFRTLDGLELSELSRDPAVMGSAFGAYEGVPDLPVHGTLDPSQMQHKQNAGVWLSHLYGNRPEHMRLCPMINDMIDKFDSLRNGIIESDVQFRALAHRLGSQILVSYYGDGDRYHQHGDEAFFTALWWFAKDESKISGGDLTIEDEKLTIPFKSNKLIVFPCYTLHAVTPVSVKLEDEYKGFGRWCVTMFL